MRICRSLGILSVVALAQACSGTVGDPSSGGPSVGPGGAGGSVSGRNGVPATGLVDGANGAQACTAATPLPSTRFARLTHRQYDNSIKDLTGLDLALAADFLADPHQAGFDRGIDLQVGDALGKAYRTAAETVAGKVVTTPASFQRVVTCDPATGDVCARTYIADFGERVYRRQLTDGEKATYLTLFRAGVDLVEAGDTFHKGVQTTLEAFLQSPNFIYRVELSHETAGGASALNGFEVAARLSYMLVNTAPDTELLDAAEGGKLIDPAEVARHAARLLGSASANDTVRDFHHQWLDLDIYANKLTKDPATYPTVNANLAPLLQEEVERFVDSVTFDQKRGLASLLTAPFTFVNATTARLYGITGTFGDTLQKVDLDPSRRAGLLTQVGFLATRAFSNLSSPIHRGVFIQRRILCADLPDPPPNIPSLPPLDGTNIKTTRQQVDQHTAPAACSGCHHQMINPIGFGLENYDAVGQYRTEENGVPIDASGTLVGTERNAAFANGVEMSRAIAESPEARACYVKNWLRYTFGRAEGAADSCAISALTSALGDDTYTPVRMLVDMTRTKAFLYRAPEVP
jgi:hypothetical protein